VAVSLLAASFLLVRQRRATHGATGAVEATASRRSTRSPGSRSKFAWSKAGGSRSSSWPPSALSRTLRS